ncbi:MAG: PIG-L family deacetylase, partial [Planctomycetes bacterium]|nr:PIG-L family deacetylase [Planctomycetota bacterium]
DHLILEFEIPKYDGDLGRPNVYLPLTAEASKRKFDAILSGFPTQRARPWFTRDTFHALMRLRGVECNSPTGLAEAFHCRKLVM